MDHEIVDRHLNLFRRYGLGNHQENENNVTHALINTLRLSDPRVTRAMLTDLLPDIVSLSVDWSDLGWALQSPPRSPSDYRHRVMLAISPIGAPAAGKDRPLDIADAMVSGAMDGVEDESEPGGRGIPDAWIYTKGTSTLCMSIEIKVRNGVDLQQIQRHERTHFGEEQATQRSLDIRWRDVSRALHKAYHQFPNPILAELISFLLAEGLGATLRFDASIVQRANGNVPEDVMTELVDRLRRELRLGTDDVVRGRPHVLIFRDFDAVGNIEVSLLGAGRDVCIETRLSFGTAKAGEGVNRLTMVDQIARMVQMLERESVQKRFIEALRATGRPLSWSVLDRLQRAQHADWNQRGSTRILEILRATGREVDPEVARCFGEDQIIPVDDLARVRGGLAALNRAGKVLGGPFQGYRVYARAYLYGREVPAYERAPQDVLPQVTLDCVTWHRILRILSGYE
jgi:hypothetical protein